MACPPQKNRAIYLNISKFAQTNGLNLSKMPLPCGYTRIKFVSHGTLSICIVIITQHIVLVNSLSQQNIVNFFKLYTIYCIYIKE